MSTFIDSSLIKIPKNRQRRAHDEGAAMELVASIQARGLLHAIVLRQDGSDVVLAAGERRFNAIQDIYALGGTFKYAGEDVPPGFVPYTNLGDLSPVEAMEVELEENIRRLDLTWQDRSAAVAALMKLRTEQARIKGLDAPTAADLARELNDISIETADGEIGYHAVKTRRELILSQHLDDPDVKKAKTLDEGYKIIKRKEEARRHAELGELVGRTFTASQHRLHNADCMAWLLEAEAEQFDVILTDPPYGMKADEFGDSGGLAAGAHGYEDSPEVVANLVFVLPHRLYRVAKPAAHLYLFCDVDWFHAWRDGVEQAGWKPFRTPLIWHKPTGMRAPWPENGPQRKYECILYAVKGDKKVTKMMGDVLSHMSDENLGHSAQKPVALYVDLLARSVSPGSTVLDPFAGSGTIFPAAHTLQCTATGVEKDPVSYGMAAKRLEGLK